MAQLFFHTVTPSPPSLLNFLLGVASIELSLLAPLLPPKLNFISSSKQKIQFLPTDLPKVFARVSNTLLLSVVSLLPTMSAPEASKALLAPSSAPIACPDQERRSQIVLKLVAENTTLSADRVQVLFDLAKKEVLRQLVASNKAPPAISESYCSWLAEKMVWARFGT